MLPDPKYMAIIIQRNTNLDWGMRSEIVLWLIGILSKSPFQQETIYLTINYMDRFLSLHEVSRDKLLLVVTVALLIATKYQEGEPIRIRDLQRLCKNTYKAKDFLKAEIIMLEKLQYRLGWPVPLIFLSRINEKDEGELKHRATIMAQYFLEAILVDKSFVAMRPSITAAAAYCLARSMLGSEWVRFLKYPISRIVYTNIILD